MPNVESMLALRSVSNNLPMTALVLKLGEVLLGELMLGALTGRLFLDA